MKSLSTVQSLAKAAKIISTILFVCAIVGLCLSAAAFVSLLFGFEAFKIGDTTIEGLIPETASMSDGNLYALLSQSMVACIIVIVLTAFAKHYLKRELADGTPFTFGGAKELLRLGVLGTVLPLAADMVMTLLSTVLEKKLPGFAAEGIHAPAWAVVGVALIVMSCLCKYGAELRSEQAQAE